MDQIVGVVVFVFALCMLFTFGGAFLRSILSAQFKRELRWKLENARRRREARRRS